MPTGYPDYFGQSIFPKYGTWTQKQGITQVPALDEQRVFIIEARGRVHFGQFLEQGSNSDAGDQYFLYVDGELVEENSIATILKTRPTKSPFPVLSVFYYDPDTPLFGISLAHDLPFEKSIELQFTSDAGVIVPVGFNIFYSILE